MRRYAILLPALLLAISSCSKKSIDGGSNKTATSKVLGDDDRCAYRVSELVDSSALISAGDSFYAAGLFTGNGISLTGIKLHSVSYTSQGSNNYVQVTVYQHLNGLPFFEDYGLYTFKNGQIYNSILAPATAALDTIPSLRISQVRKLFTDLAKDMIDTNSCVVARFGYFNLNVFNTFSSPVNLVKAWEVRQANRTFPVAYFAEDGTLVDYNTGVTVL